MRPLPTISQCVTTELQWQDFRHGGRQDRGVVGHEIRAAIREAMEGFPVTAGFTDPSQAAALQVQREIAKQAWRIELSTPRTLLESYKVLRVGPKEIAQHRDGLSLNDPMVRFFTAVGLSIAHAPRRLTARPSRARSRASTRRSIQRRRSSGW